MIMQWWSVSKIPYDKLEKLVYTFIFLCPSSTIKKEKVGTNYKGKPAYKKTYVPVSARNCSFKERGITGSLLRTILVQIRNPLINKGTYVALENNISVEEKVEAILSDKTLKDPTFDILVFHKRSDMPETEAIFYYIRNAFAHGSFQIQSSENGNVYLLESKKNKIITAQLRVKENTLKRYINLLEMTPDQIKEIRIRRKKN